MARLTTLVLGCLLISAATVDALTADEVIKLKKAGVSDSTIELLIDRGGGTRATGVWRQDGWIVHATPRSQSTYETPVFYGAPTTLFVEPFMRRYPRR